MSRIETVLSIMNQYRTKYIPVSHVSICKLVTWISPCQRINIFVHIKDIPRVSACQNVSITTHGINVWRSVTPVSLMSNVLWQQGSWHFSVRIFISSIYVPLFLFYLTFVHNLYYQFHIYLFWLEFSHLGRGAKGVLTCWLECIYNCDSNRFLFLRQFRVF